MGGYVAIAFAELYAKNISGLAFVHSLATADSEEKKEQRRKSIELLKKGGKEPFVRQMMPGLFSEKFKNEHLDEINGQVKEGLLTETDSLVAFYNAMIMRPDRINTLKNSDLPVLWVVGDEDKIASKENIMQQCSHSNVNFVKLYRNCGHMSMLEQPEKLVEDLVEFNNYCSG
jgi:pimeloyl-ACP methyl ester carboxylesterase